MRACDNLYVEDVDRNMYQCVDECERYSYKGKCVASCSGFVKGTQCVDFCKYYVEVDGVKTCQAACKIRMDGNPPYKCVDSCASRYSEMEGVCVKKGTSATVVWTTVVVVAVLAIGIAIIIVFLLKKGILKCGKPVVRRRERIDPAPAIST